MELYKDQLFHIYNQGNNRESIFLNASHYEAFLWKMKTYLLPFGSLVSYCLMPNHFHWQFYIEKAILSKVLFYEHCDSIEYERRIVKYGSKALPIKKRSPKGNEDISINEAIGILLRSYARLFNNESGRSGSLFRSHCKSRDGWIDDFISVKGKYKEKFQIDNDYAFKCMDYIHENPVEAGLVSNATDWIYSSAMDYAGLRSSSMLNLDLGRELIKFM